ncbi:MAG TPA: hypothetical protein EYH06_07440 [Chromatiales bacterium]|nr:hypothetical protein [Thiotrichales bacterium]HIP68409.1 hypothetical protein [Chromatiales bacterium]
MRFLTAGLSVMMLLTLSACASVNSGKQKVQKQEPVQVTHHCAVLNYYEALTEMTANELAQEKQMLRENLNYNQSSCYQLRLVMLLMLPEAGVKDDKEAEQILDDVLYKEASLLPQDRQIARLLSDQIQWRKKIRNSQQALKKQLKKERAASLNLLERLADTQSKLNQLKNIDKNINQREQEISTPSTDKIPHEPK